MNSRDKNFEVEPALIARYLRRLGWRTQDYGNCQRLYIDATKKSTNDEVEIFFNKNTSDYTRWREATDALITISELYDRPIDDVYSSVKSIIYDLIASRIPDEYIVNDSIQLKIAAEYINQMRNFLASAATAEITGERFYKRTRKEALVYAEKCRFGHTFKGSFGFLIESPVGLNDAPLMEIVSESEDAPFERRVVERIATGLSLYNEATVTQDIGVITGRTDGFNANMCDALADVIDETEVSRMIIAITPSPEWRSALLSDLPPVILERKNIDLLRDAAKSMRVDEDPRPVKVVGRIRRVETDGNPADLAEDNSSREIEINWPNDDNMLLHVKILLSNADYIAAVEAHKNGNFVSVSGLLTRTGRSWRLENPQDFQVVAI